jgi:hypothetical protein
MTEEQPSYEKQKRYISARSPGFGITGNDAGYGIDFQGFG